MRAAWAAATSIFDSGPRKGTPSHRARRAWIISGLSSTFIAYTSTSTLSPAPRALPAFHCTRRSVVLSLRYRLV